VKNDYTQSLPLHIEMITRKSIPEIEEFKTALYTNINLGSGELQTSLFISACRYNSIETVKLLLEHNADVNIADKNKDTPLIMACFKGHIEIVKLLLEHNANIDITDRQDCTPLDLVSQAGYIEIDELLEEKKFHYHKSVRLICISMSLIIVILALLMNKYKTPVTL